MGTDQPEKDQIFNTAAEIQDPAKRAAYLDDACGKNASLREEIEELLRHDQDGASFLESPPHGKDVTLDQPITERPGTLIGRYKLLEQIGEGGFGVVFMAEQEEPVRRKVALKIIKPGMDTREVIARFEAERQALAIMDHPNIAKVLDAGATESGRPFFVMELVRGIPITAFCDENSLTTRDRLELFTAVCQAVQHAHQKGIIHRDIKPSNVLVTMHDDRAVPKVIDFGVAKATNARLTERTLFTRFAQMVGTPLYMSPEQAQMSGLDVDTRSDIYSLGVLLYELLTGTTPFDQKRIREAAYEELLRIIREEEPPRPSLRISTLGDTLPSVAAHRKLDPKKLSALVRGELDWIVMKALEKDRTRRYETANGFASDIHRYLNDEPVEACPPSAAYRFKKFARRNKSSLLIAGLILLFLVLLGSGIGWTVRDREAREQKTVSEREAREQEISRERAARLARVSEQIELILDDLTRCEREQRWSEALVVVRRAEAVLAGGEVPEDLQAKVRQNLSDLEMVEHLEEIHLLASEVKEYRFDYEGADEQYAAAFRQYGVDVDSSALDQAAGWLRTRAGVLPGLIVALDDWANCRREMENEAGATTLTGLAQDLDADAWRRRVREALANRSEKAIEELAGSEEIAHQAPNTVALVALALKKSGRPDRALEILGEALREHPEDFWLHFDAAITSSSTCPPREDEAVRHYTAALALRPQSVVVLNNLGHALRNQQKSDEGMACFHKAIELDPEYAGAHNSLGCALAEQGKLDEAVVSFQKAIDNAPKQAAMPYTNRGLALAMQGKRDEAIACYRKAMELDPEYPSAHNYLGCALLNQGKLDEAITCLRKAVQLDPSFAIAHTNLGKTLAQQEKPEEAIACFRNAIEVDPNYALAHGNLGLALRNQGNLDEAVDCLRKAIKLDPNYSTAHGNLGIALMEQGKLGEAIASFRKALQLDPKMSWCSNYLARCLATADDSKLRNPTESLELAQKTVRLDPKPSHWSTLILAAYRAGAWKTSLDACQEKLKQNSITTEDRFFLAMIHWQLGDKAEALRWYDEAIAEFAKRKTASTSLSNLRQEAEQLLGITQPSSLSESQSGTETQEEQQAKSGSDESQGAAGQQPES